MQPHLAIGATAAAAAAAIVVDVAAADATAGAPSAATARQCMGDEAALLQSAETEKSEKPVL